MSTPTPRKIQRKKQILPDPDQHEKDELKVFCRVKPLNSCEESKQCLKLISPQEIMLICESKDHKREVSYKFNQVFSSCAAQRDIFDTVALPSLEGTLSGKNGLLFSYGVTGSGKTYTLNGNQNNPGIIPRCIDTLFNTIGDYQAPKFVIKPDGMNGFEIQSAAEAEKLRKAESKCFSKTPKSCRKNIKEITNYANDNVKICIENKTNKYYAVFVSYIEIYNNNVYDLLDDSHNPSGRLENKILRENSQRNIYVNGVKEVQVMNAFEALEIFDHGKKRKKTALTKLNADSSRSHSVFNLRVVQCDREACNSIRNTVIPEINYFKVGQLCLVDLAGSERASRTHNTGVRLKEASCINNSLMKLRTCMEILRENQRSKSNKIVPYRDSRLTFLFKSYFEGDGSVQMIVCLNPSLSDLEENLHVVKFAELSQDIKITRPKPNFTPINVRKTISKQICIPTTQSEPRMLLSPNCVIPMITFNLDAIDTFGSQIDELINAVKIHRETSKETNLECLSQMTLFRTNLINPLRIQKKNESSSLKEVYKKESEEFDEKSRNQRMENKNQTELLSPTNIVSKSPQQGPALHWLTSTPKRRRSKSAEGVCFERSSKAIFI